MPQMMPMNWILMFTALNTTIMILMIILYNINQTNFMNITLKKKINNMNPWLW